MLPMVAHFTDHICIRCGVPSSFLGIEGNFCLWSVNLSSTLFLSVSVQLLIFFFDGSSSCKTNWIGQSTQSSSRRNSFTLQSCGIIILHISCFLPCSDYEHYRS